MQSSKLYKAFAIFAILLIALAFVPAAHAAPAQGKQGGWSHVGPGNGVACDTQKPGQSAVKNPNCHEPQPLPIPGTPPQPIEIEIEVGIEQTAEAEVGDDGNAAAIIGDNNTVTQIYTEYEDSFNTENECLNNSCNEYEIEFEEEVTAPVLIGSGEISQNCVGEGACSPITTTTTTTITVGEGGTYIPGTVEGPIQTGDGTQVVGNGNTTIGNITVGDNSNFCWNCTNVTQVTGGTVTISSGSEGSPRDNNTESFRRASEKRLAEQAPELFFNTVPGCFSTTLQVVTLKKNGEINKVVDTYPTHLWAPGETFYIEDTRDYNRLQTKVDREDPVNQDCDALMKAVENVETLTEEKTGLQEELVDATSRALDAERDAAGFKTRALVAEGFTTLALTPGNQAKTNLTNAAAAELKADQNLKNATANFIDNYLFWLIIAVLVTILLITLMVTRKSAAPAVSSTKVEQH